MNPSKFYGIKQFPGLSAAADCIETMDSNTSIDVVVIPPDPDILTDNEDYDDDDLAEVQIPEDIPGTIELFTTLDDDDSIWSSSDEETLYEKQKKIKQKKKKRKLDKNNEEPTWVKCNPLYSHSNITDPTDNSNLRKQKVVEDIINLKPKEIFEKLFDDAVIQLLVDQSLLFAQQNNRHNFCVTNDEMRAFIGILLLTGYHKLPRARMYWGLDEDIKVDCVSQCLSRNKFDEIKRNLHLADNSTASSSNDKMYKVRPLMELLNKNFQHWGIFHKNLSIDEAMIKYFGHHSAKQYIRGKPVRFGFKDWMLCSSSGYCYKFDTYCGKSNDDKAVQLPLGSKVVLSLLECVKEPSDHVVYFDNFFTGVALLKTLKEKGFRATGTIRENRLKKCPLIPQKEMAKQERASYDFQFDSTNEIFFVRWNDNSVCTMATNHDTLEPLCKVKRWSKVRKEKIDLNQPYLFSSYNKGMGGVDLHDQSVSTYRIAIRGKKWWWSIFTHMINMAMTNAWKLHVLCCEEKMDQLLFTRNVVRHYLRLTNRMVSARNKHSVPSSIAKDNLGHYPKKLDKQLRCVVCHSRIRWSCKKCFVTLCVEKKCFEKFHSV